MRMSNAKALLGLGALMLANTGQAHQIWYEQLPGQPLALYYGEYDKNVLEVTPGGLDRFKQLKAWSMSAPFGLNMQRQAFALAQQPGRDDSLLAQDLHYPLFEVKEGGRPMKAHWTPATRWVGDLRARPPELTLDIVPTGVADANSAQFQVFYADKPLADQEVVLETASGEVFKQRSDAAGNVSFALPWQGTYVVAVEHQVNSPGERLSAEGKAEPFDVMRFSSTLSFQREQGRAPLPRAPSQLPASEIARLKKSA